MERKDILKSPEYWTAMTQIGLYNQAHKFMEKSGKNQTQLAEYLGVSKGYVSQLLNGDYDHRLSKFFELSLAFGVIPQIEFVPVEDCIKEDTCMQHFNNVVTQNIDDIKWSDGELQTTYSMRSDISVCPITTDTPKKVA